MRLRQKLKSGLVMFLNACLHAFLVLLGLGFVMFVISVFLGGGGFGTPISESSYTGQVVDVENDKGIIWKVDTMYARTGDDSSTTEKFCVQDEDLMNRANKYADSGERVVVTYERPLWIAPWDCEMGTTIVTDIELAGENQ